MTKKQILASCYSLKCVSYSLFFLDPSQDNISVRCLTLLAVTISQGFLMAKDFDTFEEHWWDNLADGSSICSICFVWCFPLGGRPQWPRVSLFTWHQVFLKSASLTPVGHPGHLSKVHLLGFPTQNMCFPPTLKSRKTVGHPWGRTVHPHRVLLKEPAHVSPFHSLIYLAIYIRMIMDVYFTFWITQYNISLFWFSTVQLWHWGLPQGAFWISLTCFHHSVSRVFICFLLL